MPQSRIMQHHATTQSRPLAQAKEHAAAPIAAGCSHHFPASKQEQNHTRLTANFAGRTKLNGLARCETAQNPPQEHIHASPNHSRSQHGHSGGTEQNEAHLGFTRRRSSRRFRQSVQIPTEFHAVFTRNSQGQNWPQTPPSPTHGASPTGYFWSAATSRRVQRLAARSDRSRPCACEHKPPAPAPLTSWEAL